MSTAFERSIVWVVRIVNIVVAFATLGVAVAGNQVWLHDGLSETNLVWFALATGLVWPVASP